MTKRTSPLARGCTSGAGCTWSVRNLQVFVLWIVWSVAVGVGAQRVNFTEKPNGFSSVGSPKFAFVVEAGVNGVDPCEATHCSFQCKLDQGAVEDCSDGTYSAFDLTDAVHMLTVKANTWNGTTLALGVHTWTVDTVPPTASIETSSLYTSAINITVNITFSENCPTFKCPSVSDCDLVVRGPAEVIPCTLVTLSPGLVYSIRVGLSTSVISGRVLLTTARQNCSDAAGNPYQRSNASIKVVRFNRVKPKLNLWTPIQNARVQIDDQSWTAQATDASGGVTIYLDFSEPILSNGADLLGLLHSSQGILLPRDRRSRGNRRFAFLLMLNSTRTAAVTVTLPGNTTASRYGVSVAETATVTFLHDVGNAEVLLNTNSRAHTRCRLLPFVVQFTKPVFSFNNSGVTLAGGVVRSFREISKTTYALVVWTSENSGTLRVSVAENRTLDIAGKPNVASSLLQIKHYSSTPAISVALYSFITAGLLSTAFFSGALAISAANLAAAGAVLGGRPTSCVGADASRNLLGMAGHMQVLALTSFLAVSLPVEYIETANGLQWLIPRVSPPWQKDDDTNYTTSFASTEQTNTTLNIRRSLVSALHRHVGEQPLCSACKMKHRWPAQRANSNCSVHAATTHWSDTSKGDFPSRNHKSSTHRRRRLGANGAEFGPPLVAAAYETYFLNQYATLGRLKEGLLAKKYTGWRDFQRNMFWLAVICGSLILLHLILLFFLRWRFRSPLHNALSFPRFELFLLILALPAICQACAFIIRGRTKAGIAVGVVLLGIPALLLLLTTLLLLFGIFQGKRVQYKELRPQSKQNEERPRPSPLSFLTGAGYPCQWIATTVTFIPRFGILFEDRKGPPRLVTMISNTNSNKTITSDDEHDEQAVSRAYTALGCVQATYILIDLSRRIALGVIFGAFPVSDESWTELSLVFSITAVQLLYLITTKPFQRKFVQVVETVSLLCELGIFIAAMVILSRNRPYEAHWGIGVFMLLLFVLSFFAQMTNAWFALIRQLLWFSNTEEIAPKASLIAFAVGLVLPFFPRNQWPQFDPQPPPVTRTDQRASNTRGQQQSQSSSSRPGSRSPRHDETQSSRLVGAASKSIKPVMSPPEYWPGEDLQEWARQNSLERRQLAVHSMVQEIMPADANHYDAPTATLVSRSRQRLSPPVYGDSLCYNLSSDGESSINSSELTLPRQHSIDVGPVS